jgi:DNA invertase Pin-like site-specific DNA recombinase
MPSTPRRLAFSYQRVSSSQQVQEGRDGLDRQNAAFLPFCVAHGLEPAPEALQDRGVSAFRGKHRRRGALGGFLEAARQGAIPTGSVLVVEDLDRFSREAPADALRLLLNEVFAQGLAIGVARFNCVISEEDFNSNAGAALQLQIAIQMAHDYSRKLSERNESAWAARRRRAEHGEKYGAGRPFWLDWDAATGDFKINHLADIPRRITRLSLQGYGAPAIAKLLNADGLTTSTGLPFSPSRVRNLAQDRALIGEKVWTRRDQPVRVDPAYYPPVVSQEDFNRSQQLIQTRAKNRGRVGRGSVVANIFQGITRCCECGGTLSYQAHSRHEGARYSYLVCVNKRAGARGCRSRNHKYDEPLLLVLFMHQRWQQFFHRPADSQARQAAEQQLLALEQQLGQQQQAAATAQANLATLLTSGQLDPDVANMLGASVRDAQAAAAATSDRLDAARLQLQQLQARPDGDAMAAEIEAKVAAFLAADRLDPAVRRGFNSWLSTLGLVVELHHQQQGQGRPLMLVLPTDGCDAVELHQATADGQAVHVKAAPQALAELWESYGQVETQADGSQALAIDGGAAG